MFGSSISLYFCPISCRLLMKSSWTPSCKILKIDKNSSSAEYSEEISYLRKLMQRTQSQKINKLSTTLFLSFVLNDAWLTLLLCFDIVLCYMESLNCSCSFLVWSIKSWFETSIHITVLKPPLLLSTEDLTIAKRGLHLYVNMAMTVIAWRLK